MTTLRELGIKVKSDGIKAAAKELEHLAKASGEAAEGVSGIEEKTKKTDAGAKKFDSSMGALTDKFKQFIGPATAVAGMLAAFAVNKALEYAIKLAQAMGAVVIKAVGVSDAMSHMHKSLSNVRGSSAQAGKDFATIRASLEGTPFMFGEMAGAFTSLVKDGMEPTVSVMRALADTVGHLGGDAKALTDIASTLGGAWKSNKLEMGHVNALAKHGVDVFGLLSRSLGHSSEELREFAKEGQLGRESIELLIAQLGSEHLGKAADRVDSVSGKMIELRQTVEPVFAAIGASIEEHAVAGLDEIIRLIEVLVSSGAIDGVLIAFSGIFEAVVSLTSEVVTLAEEFDWLFTGVNVAVTVATEDFKRLFEAVGNIVKLINDQIDRVKETALGMSSSLMGVAGGISGGVNPAAVYSSAAAARQAREAERQLRNRTKAEEKILKLTQAREKVVGALAEIETRIQESRQKAAEARLEQESEISRKKEENLEELAKREARLNLAEFEKRMRLEDEHFLKLNKKNLEAARIAGEAYEKEMFKALADDIEEFDKAMKEAAKPPPPTKWDVYMKNVSQITERTLGDTLYLTFTGQFDKLGEAFDNFFLMIADNASNSLADGFMRAMEGLKGGDKGAFSKMFASSEFKAGMAGLAGTMLQQYGQKVAAEGDTTVGVLMGMAGGAAAGASGGPWGAVIGAVVGGLSAYFGSQGGDEAPWLSFGVQDNRFSVAGSGGSTQLSHADWLVWEKEMNNLIQTEIGIYRDVLQSLAMTTGDLGLLDLDMTVRDFDWEGMTGTTDDISRYISDIWLPQELEEMFGPKFAEGLSGMGLNFDTIAALFYELGQLPFEERITGLSNFISTLNVTSELLEGLTEEGMLAEVRQDPFTMLTEAMKTAAFQVEVLSANWDNLSLIEQGQELENINELITQIRTAEIQYLRQLDQLQKQLNDSINSQIESLKLGGMDDQQKADYFVADLGALFQQLQADDLTSTQMAELVGQIQNRIGQITALVGEEGLDDAMSDILSSGFGGGLMEMLAASGFDPTSGGTGRDFFIALLEQIQAMANETIDAERQQIIDANEQYVSALEASIAAIEDFSSALDMWEHVRNPRNSLLWLGDIFNSSGTGIWDVERNDDGSLPSSWETGHRGGMTIGNEEGQGGGGGGDGGRDGGTGPVDGPGEDPGDGFGAGGALHDGGKSLVDALNIQNELLRQLVASGGKVPVVNIYGSLASLQTMVESTLQEYMEEGEPIG